MSLFPGVSKFPFEAIFPEHLQIFRLQESPTTLLAQRISINNKNKRSPRERENPSSPKHKVQSALSHWEASWGFKRVWSGHESHSTDRRPGQLSVQVRERKTSSAAASSASLGWFLFASALLTHAGIHRRGQSYARSMHSCLPPELLSFSRFFSSYGRRRGEEGGGAWENKNPGRKRAEEEEKTERKRGEKKEGGQKLECVCVTGSFHHGPPRHSVWLMGRSGTTSAFWMRNMTTIC